MSAADYPSASALRKRTGVRGRWREITARARQDDGVLATAWLVDELEISRPAISRAIDDGLLYRLHVGVVATERKLTGRGRMRGALLAAGDEAVIGGRGAAALHQLLPLTGPIDVLTPWQREASRGTRARAAILDPRDVTERGRIRVLTVPRLLLDCAATSVIDHLLHEAEVARCLDLAAVEDVLERHRGRRGAALLRAALDRRDPSRGRTRSQLERAGREFLVRHGFPPCERGVVFELPDRCIERDCHWPARRVVLEWDGRSVHDTARAYEKDRRDDALLLAHHGIVTVRATWRRLHEEGAELADTLWRVLGR